jgi:hypothetical protein
VNNLQGEYTYGCSLDRYVLDFFGIDEKQLLAEVAKGLGDGEIFAWIVAHAKNKKSGQEIASFSAYHEQRTGGSPEKGSECLFINHPLLLVESVKIFLPGLMF